MHTGLINIPYYIRRLDKHIAIKESLLSMIESAPGTALKNDSCFLSKTDYYISDKSNRPYINFAAPYFSELLNQVFTDNRLSLDKNSCWFQQYQKFQSHSWHTHGEAKWACVYYLELAANSPGTQFKNYLSDEHINIKVSEGDVLLFPGALMHRSPPNISNKRKTVIAFNLFE